MRLQDAAQGRDESAEEFADRCRKLCQLTVRKVQDQKVQRIINEKAEGRFLAAHIHGLRGIVGQQVQFQMPSTMQQAVKLAGTVENVEKHKHMVAGSRKVFANRKEIQDATERTPQFGRVIASGGERVQWWGARRRIVVYVPFSVYTMVWLGEHRAFIVEEFIKKMVGRR